MGLYGTPNFENNNLFAEKRARSQAVEQFQWFRIQLASKEQRNKLEIVVCLFQEVVPLLLLFTKILFEELVSHNK